MAITYPRKCPNCEYVASSPQTFSYHKRTHQPIPEGTKCCGGCNQLARFRTTNNNMWCSENFAQCPQYIMEHSDRVTKQWIGADERKATMIKTLCDPIVKKRNIDAMVATKRKNLRLFEHEAPSEMRSYKRKVHRLSQATYKDKKEILNPYDYPIGKATYHLDHKVSKHVGWLLNIPPVYIASMYNLEVIPSVINEGKGPVCSMLPSVLLEKCNAPIDLIEAVRSQEIQLGRLVGL